LTPEGMGTKALADAMGHVILWACEGLQGLAAVRRSRLERTAEKEGGGLSRLLLEMDEGFLRRITQCVAAVSFPGG
ncbi:hypothetical protein, partial [Streptomyces sp. P17]|uniref:hypothetical protein n=1 Tax=Streptomyces sp. P17 TaxID=3074716 RepID=UPI0028F42B12